MGRGKGARVKIILESTESGYRYHTARSKSTRPARLEVRKYDPRLRCHVVFKET